MKNDKKPSNLKVGKMAALQGLHKMASDMMSHDMGSIKKVSVMAKDKNGLKAGLKKAEQIVDPAEGSEAEESMETPDMENEELKKLKKKK